jgi:ABC-type phosphate/phosphonate transport system ATPase subunit
MVKIGQLFLEIPAEAPGKHREDQMTVICNVHHVNTARAYCDYIVGMSQGQIICDGPPEP